MYTSDGQFCGGIESIWFEDENRTYKFTFEGEEIIVAYSVITQNN